MLHCSGEILLGDLGLSRSLAKDTVGATKVGTQVGTPPYMSPELITGQDYGTSSDVWAVGVVLFEMLALRRPFDGANIVEMANLIDKGIPLAEARATLDASGHTLELRRLASSAGLLNPVPSERTKLSRVIEMYPPPNEGPEADTAEAALANILAGPLRPAVRNSRPASLRRRP